MEQRGEYAMPETIRKPKVIEAQQEEVRCHCGTLVGVRFWAYDNYHDVPGMYRVLVEFGKPDRVFALEKRLSCGHWFAYHAKHKRDCGQFE